MGRKKEYVKRDVQCSCGSWHYNASYDWDFTKERGTPGYKETVWMCCNCGFETPRITRNRKSLKWVAFDIYQELKAEWEPLDRELEALVDAGTVKSGWLLVHSSTFNHHLDALANYGDKKKLTRWDVQYHTRKAREDMAELRAKMDALQSPPCAP